MRKMKSLMLLIIFFGSINIYADNFYTSTEYLEKEAIPFFDELNTSLVDA